MSDEVSVQTLPIFNCLSYHRVKRVIYSWIQILYQLNVLKIFFPQSVVCIFIFLLVILEAQKFLILVKVNIIKSFFLYGLYYLSKKSLPKQSHILLYFLI